MRQAKCVMRGDVCIEYILNERCVATKLVQLDPILSSTYSLYETTGKQFYVSLFFTTA